MKISNSHNARSVATLICLFFFLLSSIAIAKETDTDNSTRVVSDKMVAQQESGVVEFIGNVKVTRTDGTITSDSLQIFFDESADEEQKESKIKKIIADGHVEFISGERRAVSDRAVYTLDDEVLILTGKAPRLWTGKNFVSGKKITLFRKTDQAVVESDGNSRVEAFFDPNDKTSKELNKKK